LQQINQKQTIDIEPKDYLFQTIVDIANNPDVKELFEQYDNDLFSVDVDKSVYRKLFLRNPRQMINTLFTKPSMSIEYLDKCYNNGIEITNVLGEDKVLEIIENVEVTDTKLFDELNNIISKDVELLGKIETLKGMNKEVEESPPLENYPKLCAILMGIAMAFLFPCGWCYIFYQIFYENQVLRLIFSSFGMFTGAMFFTLAYIFGGLCYGFPPHW